MDTPDLRYPVGKFKFPETVTPQERDQFVDEIAATPGHLRAAVAGLSDEQLDTPYRPGGWTVRQVVHHVADSHMNSFIRYRLGLTEDEPTIKPYMEDRWALLADAKMPIDVSLTLLDSLHQRWIVMLRAMGDSEWKRVIRHPEMGAFTLEKNAALYAWHGRHHVAHINSLRTRMAWT